MAEQQHQERDLDLQELKAEFQLTSQVDRLEQAHRSGHIRGRRVLEVGGTLPPRLVLGHYQAASWTSVDHRAAYTSALRGVDVSPRNRALDSESQPATGGSYAAYDGDASLLPTSFDGAFDVVFSIATLEHVGDLPNALARMHAALRPGGTLVTQVGPIWSGFRGHHIYKNHLRRAARDKEKTLDLLDHIAPWQHLIMSPADMEAWLTSRYGRTYAKAAVEWIYDSPRINRLFFSDYQTVFAEAGFSNLESIRPSGARVPPGWLPTLSPLLSLRHPGRSGFEIDCFWATLTRPA